MSDTASYTIPNLDTNPANVALWAQASFFLYMCVSSVYDLDTMSLSTDPDYAFTVMSGIGGLALLFQIKNSRMIALLIVPMLAILEDPFFLIFGLLWFAPMIYMPALAFDEFGQRPLFGKFTKKLWGTVLLAVFLLINMLDIGLLDMATEDQIEDDYSFDDDELDNLIANCEAEPDCSFPEGLPEEGSESDIVVMWKVSSMEKNIAYLGLGMMILSIIGLITMGLGLINIEGLTPTVAGVLLVGVFWVDDYLWRAVEHEGFSLESTYLLAVSGVVLMTIHGLYTLSSPSSPE